MFVFQLYVRALVIYIRNPYYLFNDCFVPYAETLGHFMPKLATVEYRMSITQVTKEKCNTNSKLDNICEMLSSFESFCLKNKNIEFNSTSVRQ